MARYAFCWTLNNYTPAQELALRGSVGQCGISYVLFGREIGDSGTPHLQGYFQANQKNYDRFKKKFGNMHIEPQRGSFTQATDYCKKDGDFFEAGTPDTTMQGKTKGQRTDLEAVKEAIERGESYDEICETHFSTAAHCSQFIKDRIQARTTTKTLNALREDLESASLRPWQRALLDILEEEAHPRRIWWIWENKGNTGKSWMATYLAVLHKAIVMTPAKKANMAYTLVGADTNIIIFDLARTNEPTDGKNWLDGTYSLAEEIKNGRVFSPMYGGKTIFFPRCHVIFFANFPPDMTKWSEDRYMIKEL